MEAGHASHAGVSVCGTGVSRVRRQYSGGTAPVTIQSLATLARPAMEVTWSTCHAAVGMRSAVSSSVR